MIEDPELLRDYAENRSEEAFAELVKRHVGLVYRVALRKVGGDTHLAEDIAQGVFTDLARKAGALSRREVLAGWLFTSAHFAATKAVRTEQRRRNREQWASTMHELSSDPSPATDWDRLRPMLDDLIHGLPEGDREALLLRFFERRDFEQIGAKLHLSAAGARSRVERALDKIRVSLAGRGITSTGVALVTALETQSLLAVPVGLASTVTSAAISGAVAAGGGTVIAVGFLMNKTLIASALAIIAIGFVAYQERQINRDTVALAEVSKDRDSLAAQLRAEQQRALLAERQAAGLKRDLDGLFAAKNASASPSLPGGPITGSVEPPQAGARFTFVKGPDDPEEGRRLVRTINGQAIDRAYAALYRKLGFTPAQQEQFRELKLDSAVNAGALFKAVAAQSPTHDRATLQTVAESANAQGVAQLQASIASAFGNETLQVMQHYESTLPARNLVVNPLVSALFYSDNPLTVQQAEQLVEIVADSARNSDGKLDLSVMNSDAMFAQAQGMLSEPQLAALRQLEYQRLHLQPAK